MSINSNDERFAAGNPWMFDFVEPLCEISVYTQSPQRSFVILFLLCVRISFGAAQAELPFQYVVRAYGRKKWKWPLNNNNSMKDEYPSYYSLTSIDFVIIWVFSSSSNESLGFCYFVRTSIEFGLRWLWKRN